MSAKFSAIINGRDTVVANDFTHLKRKASMAANKTYNAIDEMDVFENNRHLFRLVRVNGKSPNNKIKRGDWT